jgi:hypothetical protein
LVPGMLVVTCFRGDLLAFDTADGSHDVTMSAF